jgi:hypothetical protein
MIEALTDWTIAAVVATPVALWTLYEIFKAALIRIARAIATRRIIRDGWGDGHP